MIVNAPARPRPGTMDIDEFMAFIAPRPKEERWHLIEGIAVTAASQASPAMAERWCGAVKFHPVDNEDECVCLIDLRAALA